MSTTKTDEADGKVITVPVRTEDEARTATTEAAYWKARYEEERERLAKLWVAYKALEDELDQVLTPEPAGAPQ